MMHLYLLTRGIKHDIDRWVNDMQAQYFPYKYQNQDLMLQLSMRPIQLWEIVIPKSALPDVMNTLWFRPDMQDLKEYDFWKNGFTNLKPQLNMLRMALKLKTIPKMDLTKPRRIVYNQNCAIYPIGIKEDAEDAMTLTTERI